MPDPNEALLPNTMAAKTIVGLGAAGTATVLIFLINQFVDMKEQIKEMETQQKDFIIELREDEAKVLDRINSHSRRIDDLYRHLGIEIRDAK